MSREGLQPLEASAKGLRRMKTWLFPLPHERDARAHIFLLVLGGELEGYVEQLDDGQPYDHVGRNLHSAA